MIIMSINIVAVILIVSVQLRVKLVKKYEDLIRQNFFHGRDKEKSLCRLTSYYVKKRLNKYR